MINEPSATRAPLRQRHIGRRIVQGWRLYVMLILPMAYVIIFLYLPLYGVQIAFKNFSVGLGISGSPWVGLQHFRTFVQSYQFWSLIRNTLILNLYELLALFPMPVVLALLLNAIRSKLYSRGVQIITYAPHFISTVVVVGMMIMMLDPTGGLVNQVITLVGGHPVNFLGNPSYFRHVYVWSGAWQTLGYSAIIYLAALAGVDPALHEAATVDGASRLARVCYIDLPAILPVTITLMVLNMGSILSSGFEKVLLMQNPLNLSVSQVIDTYVYQVGLRSSIPQFSYAAAIGVFKSIIGLTLLILANSLARRVAKQSLF